ncbi:MAG: hypothetical protein WCQ21_28765 [Verrucomicrobiota bacterium]
MQKTAAILRAARRNLREAESALRSLEASRRAHEAEIASLRAWINEATADWRAATAAGDPLARARALQELADAHDSLRNFERLAAEFSPLRQRAQLTADHARQVVHEVSLLATNSAQPDSADSGPGELESRSRPAS